MKRPSLRREEEFVRVITTMSNHRTSRPTTWHLLFALLMLAETAQIFECDLQISTSSSSSHHSERSSSSLASVPNTQIALRRLKRDMSDIGVIEQNYIIDVYDEFVTVDNSAVFRCQIPSYVKDFVHVIAWIEDGTHVLYAPPPPRLDAPSKSGGQVQFSLSATGQYVILASGELHINRIQLKDSNKSYRCQVRNQLTSKTTMSTSGGRLFVTEQLSNMAPRIVDYKHVLVAKLGETILLPCIAQGSPTPQISWSRSLTGDTSSSNPNVLFDPLVQANVQDATTTIFEQPLATFMGATSTQLAANLVAKSSSSLALNVSSVMFASQQQQQQQQQKQSPLFDKSASNSVTIRHYVVNGNSLVIKQVQLTDSGKYRCVANNSLGTQFVETQLVVAAPISVTIEPNKEYITDVGRQVRFNCIIRGYPINQVRWLKNGKELILGPPLPARPLHQSSVVNANDHYLSTTSDNNNNNNEQQSILDNSNAIMNGNQQQSVVSSTTAGNGEMIVQWLGAVDPVDDSDQIPMGSGGGTTNDQNIANLVNGNLANRISKIRQQQQQQTTNTQWTPATTTTSAFANGQSIRSTIAANLPVYLYQLVISNVKRTDRGIYQCVAQNMYSSAQASAHLMLKDNAPQFVETFPSQLMAPNQQTSLKCIASGSPLPEITWTLDRFQVPDNSRFRIGDYVTRDSLIVSYINITNILPEDGGLYECQATNDVGQLRHAARLNVTGAPVIRTMPNITAVSGLSLAIMCPVGGWPIDQILWFQNNTKLPLNHRQKLFPNGTLIINELNEISDKGQYSCQAKNNDGLQAKSDVYITIKVPPIVEPFSFAKSLHKGQRYNVMCTVVKGDPPITINWFKDGRLIQIESPMINSNSFLIDGRNRERQLITDDANMQIVSNQMENSNSQDSQTGWINGGQNKLEQQLAIKQTANDNDQLDGQSSNEASLSSAYQSIGANGGGAVGLEGLQVRNLDQFSSTLIFGSLQSQHRGSYSCVATNEAGSASQNSTLIIHVPPEWKIEPQDMSVIVGRTVIVDCQADGFPSSRIEWRLSQDLGREPPTEFRPITSSVYMRVFENGSLIIYNAQRSDAGYYLCQATNGVGPGLSRVIKLTVHVAAHFKTKYYTETVKRGQPAKIRCEALGDTPIEVNWLKDKMPFYPQEDTRYTLVETPIQQPAGNSDGLMSEISIQASERRDSSLFTCISQNNYGNDDTSIQLIVQEPPDAPTDIKITEYEARTATISWTPAYSGQSPLIKYVISYMQTSSSSPILQAQVNNKATSGSGATTNSISGGANSQATNHEIVNITVGGNETRALLRGLSPITEYQFRVVAYNSLGSSPAHDYIIFRTDEETPGGPPLSVRAQASSSKQIRVLWRAPSTKLHYGSITGYYVGYKATDSTVDSFIYRTVEFGRHQQQQQQQQHLAAAADQQLEQESLLHGLRRGTKYSITVQAFNSKGTGPASEPIVVETWRHDIPDAPVLRLVSRTSHSVHLAWRVNNGAPSSSGGTTVTNNAVQSVQMNKQAQTNQQSTTSGQQQDNKQDDQQDPIDGFILTRRQVTSSSSTNGNQDQQQQSITALPLQSPNRSNNGDVSQASLVVTPSDYMMSGDNNGALLTSTEAPIEMRLPGDHLSQIVDNLKCGTKYLFQIVAYNSIGQSEPSELLEAKTDGSPPRKPDISHLLTLNSSTATINLAAWNSGLCSMRSFDIMYKQRRSRQWIPLTLLHVNNNNNNQATGPMNSSPNQSGELPTATTATTTTTTTNGYSNQTTTNPINSVNRIQADQGSNNNNNNNNKNQALSLAQLSRNGQQPTTPNPVIVGLLSTTNSNVIVLNELSEFHHYDLKIIATNEAGSTEGQYSFSTGNQQVLRSNIDQNELDDFDNNIYRDGSTTISLFSDNGIVFPTLTLILIVVVLVVSGSCFVLIKRRQTLSSSSSSSMSSTSASRSGQSSTYYCNSSANIYANGKGSIPVLPLNVASNTTVRYPRQTSVAMNGSMTLNHPHHHQQQQLHSQQQQHQQPHNQQQFHRLHQTLQRPLGNNSSALMSQQQTSLDNSSPHPIYGTGPDRLSESLRLEELQQQQQTKLQQHPKPALTKQQDLQDSGMMNIPELESATISDNLCAEQQQYLLQQQQESQQQQQQMIQQMLTQMQAQNAGGTIQQINNQQQLQYNTLKNNQMDASTNERKRNMMMIPPTQNIQNGSMYGATTTITNSNNLYDCQLNLNDAQATTTNNNSLLVDLINQQQHFNQQQQQLNGGEIINSNGQNCLNDNNVSNDNGQQLHNGNGKMYATVKRGYPRPPPLGDYAIYQCPVSAANMQHHLLNNVTNTQEQQQVQDVRHQLCVKSDPSAYIDNNNNNNNLYGCSNRATGLVMQSVQPAPEVVNSSSDYHDYQPLRLDDIRSNNGSNVDNSTQSVHNQQTANTLRNSQQQQISSATISNVNQPTNDNITHNWALEQILNHAHMPSSGAGLCNDNAIEDEAQLEH